MRTVLAFLLAPAVPSLLVGAYGLLIYAGYPRPPLELATFIDPVMAVVSYGTAVCLGFPTYLLAKQYLARSWWRFSTTGAVLGTVGSLLLPILTSSDAATFGVSAVFGAVYGAVGGLAFWALAIPGSTRAAV